MNSQPSDVLEIARSDFVTELQRMSKILGRRKNVGEALLIYDVGRLLIRVGGAEFAVPATGEWRGEARVSASLLRALAKVPPVQDPIIVQVNAGRLRIAGTSMTCHWQKPNTATVEVPLDLDLRGRLRLAFEHSDEQLQQAGVAPLVADARGEMEKCIADAAKALAPLGISPVDVRTLVVTRLRVTL